MQFDLISGYSARASWAGGLRVAIIEYYADNFRTVSECEGNDHFVVVVNLTPGTRYTLQLTLQDGTRCRDGFETCPADAPCLANLYQSTRRKDGVHDTTRFNKATHDAFVEHFAEFVEAGDKILAPVSLRGAKKNILTTAVTDGTTLDRVDDSSLFLPFSQSHDNVQTVTLRRGSKESTMVYDASCNSVRYRGASYAVGESMNMFGKMVTVGDGSIVLVFSDVVAQVFPFTVAQALSVVGTSRSQFMRNQVCNTANMIASKTTGAQGDTSAHIWVHDTDLGTTDEITMVVHSVDEDSTFATMSLGVLHTDASQNKFIEPALRLSSTSTTISAQDDTDATRSALFETTGLPFDSDESAVYFGAPKQFRIKFSDGSLFVFAGAKLGRCRRIHHQDRVQ
ncbi:unnamed protein product [Pylaiella littoralis]